jgi:hypothetical protein
MIRRVLGIGALIAGLGLASCTNEAYDVATELIPQQNGDARAYVGDKILRLHRSKSGFELHITHDLSNRVYNQAGGTIFQADDDGEVECVRDWYNRLSHTANSRFEKPEGHSYHSCDLSGRKLEKEQARFLSYLVKLSEGRKPESN